MIVTVTLNPSIDLSCRCRHVSPDHKLRCDHVRRDPGGGGLNVCRAIRTLGGDATAVWLSGGRTGRMLDDLLEDRGVPGRPVRIAGNTRENHYVHEDSSDREFRFILPGPEITEGELAAVEERLEELEGAEYLVLSGSAPPGAPDDCHARLAGRAGQARVVLDAGGPTLREALAGGVFLAKPNLRELSDLAGRDRLGGDEDVAEAAAEVIGRGRAEYILVSLGSGGAMLVSAERALRLHAPTVSIRSKIGAGDSMVAGTVLGLARGDCPAEAARLGVAAGSAAVLPPGTQLCRREAAARLHGEVSRPREV
jgi:6-phosphofructokinase 2